MRQRVGEGAAVAGKGARRRCPSHHDGKLNRLFVAKRLVGPAPDGADAFDGLALVCRETAKEIVRREGRVEGGGATRVPERRGRTAMPLLQMRTRSIARRPPYALTNSSGVRTIG